MAHTQIKQYDVEISASTIATFKRIASRELMESLSRIKSGTGTAEDKRAVYNMCSKLQNAQITVK